MPDFNPKTTSIIPGSLSISLDYDENPNETFPILLFTPDSQDLIHHFHIPLTKEQTQILKNWLIKNL